MRIDRKFKVEDHIGARFGSRIVLGQAEKRPTDNFQRWMMRCDCGKESPVDAAGLFRGRYLQCIACTKAAQTGPLAGNWKGGKHVPLTHYSKFKRSAARRCLEWSLSIDDIDGVFIRQKQLCALSGIPLTFDHGDGTVAGLGNASLDRIDSAKGYTVENVQLVTKDVNMGKQTLSNKEFLAMCRAVASWGNQTEKF